MRQQGIYNGAVLKAGLGNPEHSGRTRGVRVFAPWKTGRNCTKDDKRQCKKVRKELYEKDLRQRVLAEVLGELKAMYPGMPMPSLAPPPPSTCPDFREVTLLLTETQSILVIP